MKKKAKSGVAVIRHILVYWCEKVANYLQKWCKLIFLSLYNCFYITVYHIDIECHRRVLDSCVENPEAFEGVIINELSDNKVWQTDNESKSWVQHCWFYLCCFTSSWEQMFSKLKLPENSHTNLIWRGNDKICEESKNCHSSKIEMYPWCAPLFK